MRTFDRSIFASLRTRTGAAVALGCGLAFLCASAAATAAAAPGRHESFCLYEALGSGTSTSFTLPVSGSGTGGWQLTQTEQHWMALGLLGQPNTDWNLALYGWGSNGGSCVDPFTLLGYSQWVTYGVEFIVGDYSNSTLPDDEFPYVSHASGTGNAARLEWDQGPSEIVVNGPDIVRTTDASDLLTVWDVSLSANIPYSFTLERSGAADTRLFLFAPGPGFRARTGELLTTTTTASYTPASSGRFAVVVVNDNGGIGSYNLRVQSCVAPPLAVNTPVSTGGGAFSFMSTQQQWSVVGVRGVLEQGYYDLEEYSTLAPLPTCLSNLVASSVDGSLLNFVVNDLPPSTTRYPRAIRRAGFATGSIEYDVERPMSLTERTHGTFSGGDFLDIYRVPLQAQAHRLVLNASPYVGLAIFRNPGSGAYSAGMGQQLYAWSPSNTVFEAPAAGDYAVVIYSVDSGPSEYEVRWDLSPACATNAGKGIIGLYADPTAQVSCISVPPDGRWHPAWIVATLQGPTVPGIFGARFGITIPSIRGYAYQIFTTGSSKTVSDNFGVYLIGMNIPLGPCTAGTNLKVPLGRIELMNTGNGGYTELWVQGGGRFTQDTNPTGEPELEICSPPTWIQSTPGTGQILSRTIINAPTCSSCQPAVVSDASSAPLARARIRNSPDPFNPTTRIEYEMPQAGHVEIAVFDICGRLVRRLFAGPRDAEKHSIVWDGRSDRGAAVSSGLYFARLVSPAGVVTERMTLVR